MKKQGEVILDVGCRCSGGSESNPWLWLGNVCVRKESVELTVLVVRVVMITRVADVVVV